MARTQSFLVLVLIDYAFARVAIRAKAGDRVVLDFGPRVYFWQRDRMNGIKEMMTRCQYGDTRAICQGFVRRDGKPATPPSYVLIDGDGKMILNPVVATDSGFYSAMVNGVTMQGLKRRNSRGRLLTHHLFLQVTE
ncbi:unnamed protein product [Angiostrongylus costaricensis]|uniref:Bulb-type lectin domain-containing protein n=1 Tax=Angiostrongylus costaricensis TaxID=334426 RepID=A0A0R3PIC9_ANGCS|nr:unnamed protein product [Angiostrongylus costaricensis]